MRIGTGGCLSPDGPRSLFHARLSSPLFSVAEEPVGYDIEAFLTRHPPADPADVASSDDLGDSIAELHMTAGSRNARALFEALNATDHDGRVSGTGIGRYFSHDELRPAMRRLCQSYLDGRTTERTVRFLAQVIERLGPEPWVYIEFA